MPENVSRLIPEGPKVGPMGEARSVFVSYSVQDRARAAHIVRALRGAGMQTFWDQDLQPRTDFRASIEEQIRKSDVTLVLWTRFSVRSHFVAEEAQLAKKLGRYLPVLLERVKLPLGLASDQFAWLDSWTGEPDSPQWEAVLRAIRVPVPASRSKVAALDSFRDRPDMPLMLPLTFIHSETDTPEVRQVAVSADLVTRSELDRWLQRERTPVGDRDHLHIGPFAEYARSSFVEAQAYCRWLSGESGHLYRMPTWLEFRVLAQTFVGPASAGRHGEIFASPGETVAELMHLCGALWTWIARDGFASSELTDRQPLAYAAGGCWCTAVPLGSIPIVRFQANARPPFVGLRVVRENGEMQLGS